jgi:hypothetical protein
MAGYRGLAAVVENPNKRLLLTRSARIYSLAGQDDGRRATQTNDGIGGEGRADAAPEQAKDPKRAENEGDSEQCHSRQAECEAHAVHDSGMRVISIPAASPPFR